MGDTGKGAVDAVAGESGRSAEPGGPGETGGGEAADEPPSGAYELRSHGGWETAARATVIAAVVTGVIPGPVDGHPTWGSLSYGLFLASWGVVFMARQHQLHAMGCLMRIDAAGLTVAGQPTVPWQDVRKAVVRRRAVVFFSWGIDTELPMLPTGYRMRNGARTRRRLTEKFGSPMVVPLGLYGVRRAEVLAAVRTYCGKVAVFG
ncbi:MAG: hypothetical protein HOY76_06365 [Streptomyces sp.]|nr:hypothetical protein [Streptomyces sp.]